MDRSDLANLAAEAWSGRENARVLTGVKVGSALMTANGRVYRGCNIEHRYRCHDVHAEVNAISNMICAGERIIQGIVVAARTEMFTPCGGCMDWIVEFGGSDCLVSFQAEPNGPLQTFTTAELMPHYPALDS